jgi:hypothetical protein
MSTHLFETKRYELKYTITEELAAEIRDYIENICTMDKHVPPGENGYVVNNLYFDTPDLRFYYDTKFRKMTRYKIRARFYGERPTDFIWPEIKYRNASVIWKKRTSLPIEQWPTLFSAQQSERTEPIVKNQIDSFKEMIYWCGAQPTLHVRYFREPYVTDLEEYGRVTFDRMICCRPTYGSIELAYREEEMLYFDDPVDIMGVNCPVVLEIKVESMVPIWAIELIHKFNLNQRGFSKYGYGIDSILGQSEYSRIAVFDGD